MSPRRVGHALNFYIALIETSRSDENKEHHRFLALSASAIVLWRSLRQENDPLYMDTFIITVPVSNDRKCLAHDNVLTITSCVYHVGEVQRPINGGRKYLHYILPYKNTLSWLNSMLDARHPTVRSRLLVTISEFQYFVCYSLQPEH